METDTRPSFAALLRGHRLARGLTQEALADAAGLSREAIVLLERGARRSPRRDTVALLARALGLSADERARLLAAAAIGRGTPAPPASAPASALPARLTSFIGRETEIAEVRELVLAKRLVTLTGAGGIGKTSLALAVADTVRARFAEGVALVDLAAVADGELVPQAVAAAVGVPERPGEPILATLGRSLGTGQRLLLLDNCEHLVLNCARVAEALLLACPSLHILATSREPLRIGGEVIWRVPPLTLPGDGAQPLGEVAASEAVRLFVARSDAVRPGFALTAANAGAVAEICRRLDGIPLAIELAAARMGVLTPEQIARHLTDRFHLLTQGGRTAVPRHQTLRALIDWSYALLTEPERVLFNRLAVFGAGFDLQAARRVNGAAPLAAEDILDLLAGLVDKSLVVALSPGSGEARYRLLSTIQEYAGERLTAAGEAEVLRGRHAAYFLAYAEEFSELEHTARQSEWLARLDLDRDNLRQAVEWWMSHDIERALRLVSALWYGWWRRGRQTELRGWIAHLLPGRHAFPRTTSLARFLRGAGECADPADLATRRALLEESVAVSRDAGDRRGAADALWILASDAYSLGGDYAGARALYAECLADADAEVRTRALFGLATIARRTGDVDQARILSEEAVASARQTGVPMDIGCALDQQGKLERMQGNLARAVALSEESLAVYRDGRLENVVHLMSRALGRLARLQGNYTGAHILQGEALAGAREVLDRPMEAMALDELGLIAAAEGDLAGARRHLEEALTIARDGMRWVTAEVIASLGLVARAEGKLAEARQLFDAALTFWREVGNPHGVVVAKGHLGVVALQEGNLARARDLFGQSLAVRHALGDQGGTATLLECFAGLSSLRDEPVRAFQLLGAADRIRSTIGNPAPPIWRSQRDPWMEPARRALDDRARLQAYVAGQTTGWEVIISDALPGGLRV